MSKEVSGGSIRFKELMEKTVKDLNDLSSLTYKMLVDSIEALTKDDEELYKKIKLENEEVKKIRASLETSIVNSITLHQPFASDLRFLISSLKIANEIERTARDAVHVAHSSKFFDHNMESLTITVQEIGSLAKKALDMYIESIHFFINRRETDFNRWTKLDDEIDKKHNKLISDVIDNMVDSKESIRAGVSLILTTRYIERIADHACNIAEESIFVATSKRKDIS